MDKKQTTILDKVLDKFELDDPSKFIQHRNLNEFKYFNIEKVNPNHRIILYGILKNNDKKKNISKNMIKAGEIIIITSSILIDFKIITSNISLISLIFSMFSLNIFLFYIFGEVNILRGVLNNYWYRRFHGRWENSFNGS